MINNHSHFSLLERYLEDTSGCAWALATVVNKEGSSYRSPGAMMLVNNLGQSFGLVSGGCLEADIVRRAKQVFHSGQAAYVEYDMREEDSYAAELGIGCKGKIGILIQHLDERHRAVLQQLYEQLTAGQACYLIQAFATEHNESALNELTLLDASGSWLSSTGTDERHDDLASAADGTSHKTIVANGVRYSLAKVNPPFDLWIFGGGADARPLLNMASQIGWRVTLVDHRSAYARASAFPQADTILKEKPDSLDPTQYSHRIDAAVLMTHNVQLDAQWLTFLYRHCSAQYIGLLGPSARKQAVLEASAITDTVWFDQQVNGPAGLDLGGELPESIALSILAQCHAVLLGRNGISLDAGNTDKSGFTPRLVNDS